MSTSNTSKRSYPSQRPYPPEIRERAVRMVREAFKESSRSHGVTRVAARVGPGRRRSWEAEAHHGGGPSRGAVG